MRTAADADTRTLDRAMAVGALVLVGLGAYCAHWLLSDAYRPFHLADLAVYRAAARAVLDGHSVYGDYVREQLDVHLPFIYPPIAALFTIPFTWMGRRPGELVYTALCLVLLGAVVRVCFAQLLGRMSRVPLAFTLTFLAVLALSPVEEHLSFGQVGIPLLACCVFDCMTARPRWPRGLLVGAATAVKLVPGIFVPYFLLTRRWRAAAVSVVTFGVLTLVGALAAPSDSWKFFTDKMFEPTSPEFFANQSLEGILQRALGPWQLVWVPLVIVIAAFGLWRASLVSLAGDELRGVAITGLVGVLVSPISWIHHLVWVVPALAVIIGRGTDRRRVAAAFVLAALFVLRLPYVGAETLDGTGFVANVLEDAYGLLCLGMFVWMTDAIPIARDAIRGRAGARSRATTPAAPR